MSDVQKNFLFAVSLGLLILFTFFFVSYSDPDRVWEMPWTVASRSHFNDYLTRIEELDSLRQTDTYIIGSSTSESFWPQDLEALTGYRVHHGSIPGSLLPGRLAVLSGAQEKLPELQRVLYIADFYEMNQNYPQFFDPRIYDNSMVSHYLPGDWQDRSPKDFKRWLWKFLSMEMLEKSVSHLKARAKGVDSIRPKHLNQPAAVVDRQRCHEILSQTSARGELSGKLKTKIGESLFEYKGRVMNNFSYSAEMEALLEDMVTQNPAIDYYFILSPYHPVFRKDLLWSPELRKDYLRWRHFYHELGRTYSNVQVLDSTTEPHRLFPDDEKFWDDGVHYSREAAQQLIFQLFQGGCS